MIRILFFFVGHALRQIGIAILPILFGASTVAFQWGFRLANECKYEAHSNDNVRTLAQCVVGVVGPAGTSIVLPAEYWHQMLFFAQSVSIFSAFVLYYHFPASYQYLQLSTWARAVLHLVIPTLQALAVAFAFLKIDDAHLHALATTIYLLLFVIWDYIVLGANVDPSNLKPGQAFRSRVMEYRDVDVTYFTICAVFFYLTADKGEYGAFAAGVLTTQAFLASFVAGRTYWRDHLVPSWSQIRKRINQVFSKASNAGGLQ